MAVISSFLRLEDAEFLEIYEQDAAANSVSFTYCNSFTVTNGILNAVSPVTALLNYNSDFSVLEDRFLWFENQWWYVSAACEIAKSSSSGVYTVSLGEVQLTRCGRSWWPSNKTKIARNGIITQEIASANGCYFDIYKTTPYKIRFSSNIGTKDGEIDLMLASSETVEYDYATAASEFEWLYETYIAAENGCYFVPDGVPITIADNGTYKRITFANAVKIAKTTMPDYPLTVEELPATNELNPFAYDRPSTSGSPNIVPLTFYTGAAIDENGSVYGTGETVIQYQMPIRGNMAYGGWPQTQAEKFKGLYYYTIEGEIKQLRHIPESTEFSCSDITVTDSYKIQEVSTTGGNNQSNANRVKETIDIYYYDSVTIEPTTGQISSVGERHLLHIDNKDQDFSNPKVQPIPHTCTASYYNALKGKYFYLSGYLDGSSGTQYYGWAKFNSISFERYNIDGSLIWSEHMAYYMVKSVPDQTSQRVKCYIKSNKLHIAKALQHTSYLRSIGGTQYINTHLEKGDGWLNTIQITGGEYEFDPAFAILAMDNLTFMEDVSHFLSSVLTDEQKTEVFALRREINAGTATLPDFNEVYIDVLNRYGDAGFYACVAYVFYNNFDTFEEQQAYLDTLTDVELEAFGRYIDRVESGTVTPLPIKNIGFATNGWAYPRVQIEWDTIEEHPQTGSSLFGAWYSGNQIAMAYINNIMYSGLYVFTGDTGSGHDYYGWPSSVDLDGLTQTIIENNQDYSLKYPLGRQVDAYSPFIYTINSQGENEVGSTFAIDMKLYACRMWQHVMKSDTGVAVSQIIRDFIPCIKMSTWDAGLYDLKNHVFYNNIATGYFQYSGEDLFLFDDTMSQADESAEYETVGGGKGKELIPMSGGVNPDTLTSPYIKSDGRQFIDTGVLADRSTRIELQYREEETKYVAKGTAYYSDTACTVSAGTLIYGGRPCAQVFSTYGTIKMTSSDTVYYVKSADIKSSYGVKSAYLIGARDKDDSHSISNRITLESTATTLNYSSYTRKYQAHRNADGLVNTVLISGSGGCKFNSHKIKFTAPVKFETHRTMYLFGCNNAGQPFGLDAMRLYYCKIWKSGVLVRDFAPAIKNNVVGLYDQVESKFYTNKGQGVFTYGGSNIMTIGD